MWDVFHQWSKKSHETSSKKGSLRLNPPLGPAWSYRTSTSRGWKSFLRSEFQLCYFWKQVMKQCEMDLVSFRDYLLVTNPTSRPPPPSNGCDRSHFKTFTALNRKFDLYAGPALQRKHRPMQNVMFSRSLAGEKTITPWGFDDSWVFQSNLCKITQTFPPFSLTCAYLQSMLKFFPFYSATPIFPYISLWYIQMIFVKCGSEFVSTTCTNPAIHWASQGAVGQSLDCQSCPWLHHFISKQFKMWEHTENLP